LQEVDVYVDILALSAAEEEAERLRIEAERE